MFQQSSIKFLIDESVEYDIVLHLRELKFDVTSISEENPSISDYEVLETVYIEQRVLITNDKGFSKLVFKEKMKSNGVILMRLPYASTDEKCFKIDKLLKSTKDVENLFTTVTATRIRYKLLPKRKTLRVLSRIF